MRQALLRFLSGVWQICQAFCLAAEWGIERFGAFLGSAPVRQFWQRIRRGFFRLFFGTWWRALVTLAILAIVTAQMHPQLWPSLAILIGIAVAILGIRVMLSPMWPLGRRRERGRENR